MFKDRDIVQCIKTKSETDKKVEIDDKHLNEFFQVREIDKEFYIPRCGETWIGINKDLKNKSGNWTLKVWNISHNNFKNMFKLICNEKDLKFLTTNDFKDKQELILINADSIYQKSYVMVKNGKQFLEEYVYRNDTTMINGIRTSEECLNNCFILKSDWDILVKNSNEKVKWNYVDLTTLKIGDKFVLVEEIDFNQGCQFQGKLPRDDKFTLFTTYEIDYSDGDTHYLKTDNNYRRDVKREQFKNKFVTLQEYERVMKSKPKVISTDEPDIIKELKFYNDFLPLYNVNYEKFAALMKGELFK